MSGWSGMDWLGAALISVSCSAQVCLIKRQHIGAPFTSRVCILEVEVEKERFFWFKMAYVSLVCFL